MTPSRIFDILSIQVESHPLEKCLSDKRNGCWESISTQKFFESVNYVSAALIEMGVKPHDKIALISTTNRSEWSILDMSILQVGAISVPLYPNLNAESLNKILIHSESKLLFVGKMDNFCSIKSGIPTDMDCITFPFYSEDFPRWDDLIKDVQPFNENIIRDSKELATIIYTSGANFSCKQIKSF